MTGHIFQSRLTVRRMFTVSPASQILGRTSNSGSPHNKCVTQHGTSTMKFCKNLQRVVDISDPEWAPYWTNYKMLKVCRERRRLSSCHAPWRVLEFVSIGGTSVCFREWSVRLTIRIYQRLSDSYMFFVSGLPQLHFS
jgi:hypothetical protein